MSSVGSASTGGDGSDGSTCVFRSVRIRGGGVDGTTGSGVVGGAASDRGGGTAMDSWSETCWDSGRGSNSAFCAPSLDAADSSIGDSYFLKYSDVFEYTRA